MVSQHPNQSNRPFFKFTSPSSQRKPTQKGRESCKDLPSKNKNMAGGGDEMKVLGTWYSPFSARVTIALKLKGVEYEYLEEAFGVKSELLLQSNPVYKKVPVLLHNGKPVSESMIIVEYIDDVWSTSGNAILPAEPWDRATARFWAKYIDDKLYSDISGIITPQTEEAKVKSAEQLSVSLLLLEEAFEKCSNGKSFFGGDTIGYLDIALGVYADWLVAAEKIAGIKILDEEKIPLLVGWADRFRSAEVVRELMPEADEIVKIMKDMYGGAPAAQ